MADARAPSVPGTTGTQHRRRRTPPRERRASSRRRAAESHELKSHSPEPPSDAAAVRVPALARFAAKLLLDDSAVDRRGSTTNTGTRDEAPREERAYAFWRFDCQGRRPQNGAPPDAPNRNRGSVVDPIHRPRRQLLSVSADGIVIEAVRRAVYLGEDARQHLVDAGRAPAARQGRSGCPVSRKGYHSIGYLVESLIPRHRLELGVNATAFRGCSAAALPRDRGRILFEGYRESGTHAPTRCRARRVAANPHRAFVFNRHLHGAVRQTPLAG